MSLPDSNTQLTPGPFTVTTPPSTDIWRKPPSTDVCTAPLHNLLPAKTKEVPLAAFKRARVSFEGDWTERYDQGGIYLEINKKDSKDADGKNNKWLKAGVEFYQGAPAISTVGTDVWSDWAVFPLNTVGGNPKGAIIEVRREGDELGKSLWAYAIVLDESGNETKRVPLREINWFFAEEAEETVSISAYAARPAAVEGSLDVVFHGGEVELFKP